MALQLLILCFALSLLTLGAGAAEPPYAGADISDLPSHEADGAVYRDEQGAADAIEIFRRNGINLFRVRVFVNPDTTQQHGDTQDLEAVRSLAKRIKASGAAFLLDFHYSDEWAGPGHQYKPEAWKDVHGEELEQLVYDHTAEVLAALASDGLTPEMVQVGNEVTKGFLWPDGSIPLQEEPTAEEPKSDGAGGNLDDTATTRPLSSKERAEQWDRASGLLAAGVRAVRDASTPEQPIEVVIHIHAGDWPGHVEYWYGELAKRGVDYDVIALTYYAFWCKPGSFQHVQDNMRAAVETFDKDVLLAEVAHPYREKNTGDPTWPATPKGQADFLSALWDANDAVPDGRGLGVVYWYPESFPTPMEGRRVWMGGRNALFDNDGRALPGLKALGRTMVDE